MKKLIYAAIAFNLLIIDISPAWAEDRVPYRALTREEIDEMVYSYPQVFFVLSGALSELCQESDKSLDARKIEARNLIYAAKSYIALKKYAGTHSAAEINLENSWVRYDQINTREVDKLLRKAKTFFAENKILPSKGSTLNELDASLVFQTTLQKMR